MRKVGAIALGAAFVAVACADSDAGSESVASLSTQPPVASSSAGPVEAHSSSKAAQIDAEPGDKPGTAYFAVRDEGLFRLRGSTFERVEGMSARHPGGSTPDRPWARAATLDGDGVLHLLTTGAIHRLKGGRMERFADIETHAPTIWADVFTVAASGTVWTAGAFQVARHEAGVWEVESLDVHVTGVAQDGRGVVWLATDQGALARVGDAWRTVKLGSGSAKPVELEGCATDRRTGDVLLVGRKKIYRARGTDDVTPMELLAAVPELTNLKVGVQLDTVATNDAGQVVVVFYGGRSLARTGLDGTVVLDRSGSDFQGFQGCGGICANVPMPGVALDDRGRAWFPTAEGLAVLGPGTERAFIPTGSVAALVGEIEAIAVVGNGPPTPVGGPVRVRTVRGRLVTDGKPLRRGRFELCPRPELVRGTPCSRSSVRGMGQTGDDGRFELEGLALGSYSLCTLGLTNYCTRLGVARDVAEPWDVGDVEVR